MGYQPRPPPTPRPSSGDGYCSACGSRAALDEASRCTGCRPVQQVSRATGGSTWGDALPSDYLPPGVR